MCICTSKMYTYASMEGPSLSSTFSVKAESQHCKDRLRTWIRTYAEKHLQVCDDGDDADDFDDDDGDVFISCIRYICIVSGG